MEKRAKRWAIIGISIGGGALTLLGLVIVCTCAGLLYWCQPRDYNVTGDPRYPTDFVKDRVYILKEDVFYSNGGLNPGTSASGYPDSDRGVVKKGTRLRFVEMHYRTNPENGDSFEPRVTIMDGPFAGTTVSVYFISSDWLTRHEHTYSSDPPRIDPDFLEVESAGTASAPAK